MATTRTVQQIEDAAKSLPAGGIVTVTVEEAGLLVLQHQTYRVEHGKVAPATAYLMKKLSSGRTKIHGRTVEVK